MLNSIIKEERWQENKSYFLAKFYFVILITFFSYILYNLLTLFLKNHVFNQTTLVLGVVLLMIAILAILAIQITPNSIKITQCSLVLKYIGYERKIDWGTVKEIIPLKENFLESPLLILLKNGKKYTISLNSSLSEKVLATFVEKQKRER